MWHILHEVSALDQPHTLTSVRGAGLWVQSRLVPEPALKASLAGCLMQYTSQISPLCHMQCIQ